LTLAVYTALNNQSTNQPSLGYEALQLSTPHEKGNTGELQYEVCLSVI